MIALEEIEIIEPAEIANLEKSARRLPGGPDFEPDNELQESLAAFQEALHAIYLNRFSVGASSYLEFQGQIEEIKKLGITAQSAPVLRPPIDDLARAIGRTRAQIEVARGSAPEASGLVLDDMTHLLGRMQHNVDLLLEACDQALEAGNRAHRRSDELGSAGRF